ncbi:MAG TPA: shikimate dehydrogenase [Candidatus Binatia bacterium]|jgi:shikimate dehydrogenase
MPAPDEIDRIQSCIQNRLGLKALGTKRFAAVIGDAPSRYSKSPAMWNAAFDALGIKAVYLPLDVDDSRLAALLAAIKESDRWLGLNVTVPHKLAVMKHLDSIDGKAAGIGAVNTIVRTDDGRLVGANTDGEGFMQSLPTVQPGSAAPFLASLDGISVMILGAGGSARAVAFALAEKRERGQIYVANRTHQSAVSLAGEIGKSFGGVTAIREEEVPEYARRVGLIVNCTTKGQGGIRKNAGGATVLEPYSALAPAHPTGVPQPSDGELELYRACLSASLPDIEANNNASWNLALSIPSGAGFYDLVYHPAETVFLRHGRVSGHRTLNGQGIIVAQAVEGFFNHVCRRVLEGAGLYTEKTRRRILEVMTQAW